jgi:hypothetical protein
MNYESTVTRQSAVLPEVRYGVRRMSYGRRLDLTRQLKDLLGRIEFARAGEDGPAREAEMALLAGEVDREYLRWGLAELEGLDIDGTTATPETLFAGGPEELVREIVDEIRQQAGLTENERKNFESHSTSFGAAEPGGNATNAAS